MSQAKNNFKEKYTNLEYLIEKPISYTLHLFLERTGLILHMKLRIVTFTSFLNKY